MPEPAAAPVARELPPAVSRFAGRADDLAALNGAPRESRADGGVVISAIAGTAGRARPGWPRAGPGHPGRDRERAGMYRDLLAGRRIVIPLDNARDAGRARPLLPGTAGRLRVVTSRDSLAGWARVANYHPFAHFEVDLSAYCSAERDEVRATIVDDLPPPSLTNDRDHDPNVQQSACLYVYRVW